MSVSCDRVTIRFRASVEAVSDVSLDVARGEFVAIVGPSGCGKSTLLNAIADLLDPAICEVTGRIEIDGAGRRERTRRDANLGYVFQRDALLPWQTLLENTQLGLAIRGIGKERRLARARELIAMAGLAGFEHYYPHQVSGGMRQRASLVRTLAYEPQTILMDEPFGALDAQNRMVLQAELLKIWQETPRTILFVTHDLAEAIGLVLGIIGGAALGLGLAYLRGTSEVVEPVLVSLNSLPRIAVAPILLPLFGLGIASKIALSFFTVFFVVFFNTYLGIRSVDPELVKAVQVMGGSRAHLARFVVLPSVLSWIFAALRTSVSFALTGAVVGEFVGASAGAGYRLNISAGLLDTKRVYLILLILMVFAVTLVEIAKRVEARLLRWRPSATLGT